MLQKIHTDQRSKLSQSTIITLMSIKLNCEDCCIDAELPHDLLTLGAHAHSEGNCSCRVCMCVCVCVCVCMYVWPLITSASHTGITKQRYQRVHSNTAIVLNFADFPKNASFKSYGVMLTSSSSGVLELFSPWNKLLCYRKAYSYVLTAQTTGQWKTACDSLAQTRETAQIYGSQILIASPTITHFRNVNRHSIHNYSPRVGSRTCCCYVAVY